MHSVSAAIFVAPTPNKAEVAANASREVADEYVQVSCSACDKYMYRSTQQWVVSISMFYMWSSYSNYLD
jgi:hypothetical protein